MLIKKLEKSEYIAFAADFVESILVNDSWFAEIYKKNLYSVVILIGSVVQGGSDHLSDLDIFLVVPFDIQVKYNLRPEYEYVFKGVNVEVSLISTEKMINDSKTKKSIRWWKDAVILKSTDPKYSDILKIAGSLTIEEKKDQLWTLMSCFEMNLVDIDRIMKREDFLSFKLYLYDSIKIFSEFVLLDVDISKRFKWYGSLIEEKFPDVYEEILKIINEESLEHSFVSLKKLRNFFKKILRKNGFKDAEIDNWSQNNLKRLIIQKF